MIVVSFLFIVFNISIIGLIVNFSYIVIFCCWSIFSSLASIFSSEVISKGWILVKGHRFKLTIGIEAKDSCKDIIGKAYDGVCVNIFEFAASKAEIFSVLDGREKVNHKDYGKINAEKDVEHKALVTALMLNSVQK